MKNKIISITVESRVDEYPDLSTLGEYTNHADDWNIDRKTERFVISETKRNSLIEQLEEKIYEKENDNPNFSKIDIERTEKRIEKLKNCFDTIYLDRNQYRYFKPYAAGEKPGTPEYKKYAFQDYQRMEAYNNGSWCYLGIMVKATIRTESGSLQHITSGGLWGIESDSGKDFLDETIKGEIASLRNELLSLGFSQRAITYAVNRWNGELVNK